MLPQLSAGAVVPWALVSSGEVVVVLFILYFISFYTSLSQLFCLSLPFPSSPVPSTPLSAFSVYSAYSFTLPFALSPFSFLLFDISLVQRSPLLALQLASLLFLLSFLIPEGDLNSRKHTVWDLGSRPDALPVTYLNVSLWVFWPSFLS